LDRTKDHILDNPLRHIGEETKIRYPNQRRWLGQWRSSAIAMVAQWEHIYVIHVKLREKKRRFYVLHFLARQNLYKETKNFSMRT
jgi:hypothetical protein